MSRKVSSPGLYPRVLPPTGITVINLSFPGNNPVGTLLRPSFQHLYSPSQGRLNQPFLLKTHLFAPLCTVRFLTKRRESGGPDQGVLPKGRNSADQEYHRFEQK